MKQKILVVFDIEYLRDSSYKCCSAGCPFGERTVEDPPWCKLFDEGLELGEDGVRRSPKCLVAAGNHNILSKCLAGE